ncbi:hypothetical protein L6164_008267 [Bauhinia variegata]|uniref:Uncharacterized protein n=1 Tax=Bauhinia variegata TaxID=167791 RepID=A0ACB9PHM5_BAUVA|nr:hypothetical protein L6164_008267 [Bauhinia variegata]
MDETARKKLKPVREPPSVPFIWEVEPGIPNKDFTPQVSSSVTRLPTIPLKLIASVPFAWEEQPGKPIPNFSPISVASAPPDPGIGLTEVASSSGYPVACSYGSDEESSSDDAYENGRYGDGNEIWEEKPRVPKKDFTPVVSSATMLPTIPPKLIASVPFAWEQQPGKPIPNFSPMSVASAPPNPEIGLTNVASSSGYPMACNYGNDEEGSSEDAYEDGNETMSTETFGFETDESYCSVPSLLANALAPSVKISAAIPQQKTSLSEHSRVETPSPVSETGSSTSSYATGSSSLVGASFLERLFPLLQPNSGFHVKAEYSEKRSTYKDFDHEDDASVMERRPPTLGELIMMSRRRSYQRKAIQMRKWDPPRGITTNKAFGCSIFGISSQMIEELQRKCFRSLKLV